MHGVAPVGLNFVLKPEEGNTDATALGCESIGSLQDPSMESTIS